MRRDNGTRARHRGIVEDLCGTLPGSRGYFSADLKSASGQVLGRVTGNVQGSAGGGGRLEGRSPWSDPKEISGRLASPFPLHSRRRVLQYRH